jgi:hypothetical protein
MGAISSDDRPVVRRQLGRDPRPFEVAARCPYGKPSVIENEPSRSMPTRFWVTCASLAADISRIEAEGGVRAAQEEIGTEPVEATHAEHERLYGNRVAGIRDGGYVKCLHAFTALHLADGGIPNPVAEWTLERLQRPHAEGCCTLDIE